MGLGTGTPLCWAMAKFIFNFRSNLQKTKKFFINKKEGECKINFDGIPFSIEEEKILDCQYGKHYYKEKSAGNSKRQRFQGTKKIGCQAKIKIKTFHLYPEYRITVDENKTHKERQQIQNSTLESLRTVLQKQTSGVQVEIKYWISLPSAHAQTGHPVGNEAGFSQRIHPLLASKITEMVISGITSTSEVKRSLNLYATNVLAPQLGIALSKQY